MENNKMINDIKKRIDDAIVNFLVKNSMPVKNVISEVSTLSQSVRENIENNGYCVIFSKLHDYAFAPMEYPFITYPWNLATYVDSPEKALVQCEIMDEMHDLVADIFQVDKDDWQIAKYDWRLYYSFMSEIAAQTVEHKLPECFSEFLCSDTSLDLIIDSINEINNAIKQGELDDSVELCGEYIDLSEVAETGYVVSRGDEYDVFGDNSDITKTLQYFFVTYVAKLTGASIVKYSSLIN